MTALLRRWMWPVVTLLAILHTVQSQRGGSPVQLPSTFPHVYPGQPAGNFSPEWQSYFQVTEPLPNITFDLGRNWAGNLPVQRDGHPNDTLFFWAFETRNGSLTAAANENSDEPWGIWLNGGPGSSSLVGLLFENGPIRIGGNYSASENTFGWNKQADYIWIDQPVGTGFSTADASGYIADEDQMGRDFFGFLGNLVKVFPSLATRPLHLTGESYAGTYIPYITKTYFGLENPPVKLAKIAIGDGTLASAQVFELLPAVSVLETYPQIIGYDTEVFKYFEEQEHLCGFDVNLTYPQDGIMPSIKFIPPSAGFQGRTTATRKNFFPKLLSEYASRTTAEASLHKRKQLENREQWKRDLSGRANGTIDPWYGCDLFDEFFDYAINFTFPWNITHSFGGFDVYDIQDALSPEAPMDGSVFLNDNRTRAAIHAPTVKDWVESFNFPFGNLTDDPSPEPMVFLTDLATNATAHNVSIIIYSGNDDSLVPHRGSEVAIQNTTFGGIQGFTRKPSTPWTDDAGNFAGIVHQERNWTYVLFNHAGHLVPAKQPALAAIFLREFVLGNNQTGLVTNSSGTINVNGGENAPLAGDILPGQPELFYGSGSTVSTYFFPSATVAAWNSFIITATATATTSSSAASGTSGVGASSNGGRRDAMPCISAVGVVLLIILIFV